MSIHLKRLKRKYYVQILATSDHPPQSHTYRRTRETLWLQTSDKRSILLTRKRRCPHTKPPQLLRLEKGDRQRHQTEGECREKLLQTKIFQRNSKPNSAVIHVGITEGLRNLTRHRPYMYQNKLIKEVISYCYRII